MMEENVPQIYWREIVSTTIYTLNQVQIRSKTGKTPYELLFGITSTVKYFRVFGSKYYIKRDEDLGKFDARSDEGIFLGYSTQSKAYQYYNKRLRKIIESTNVNVDEDMEKPSRYYEYEADDQNDISDQEEQVQTPVQISFSYK